VASPNPSGVAEAKKALRRRVLETRATFDARDLANAARGLRDVLLATPEVVSARRVAAYVSVGREPGTGPLIEELSDAGVEVLLPLLQPDGDLDWAPYEGPRALARVARGLLEPTGEPLGSEAVVSCDAVLVPGLAVDRSGTRLGRGGGSYDRVLARVAGRVFSCVLLHDGEVLDLPVPRDRHDVPVAAAATPSRLHRLGRIE
jgi:5-formyltetrahydrofolate cyclo-ligase